MVKINANFSKLNAALKQVGAELNFRYHFVNNRCKFMFSQLANSNFTLPITWEKAVTTCTSEFRC